MTFTPEILYGVGTVALFAALIYAIMRNMGRNRRNDALREQATHELYEHSDEEYRKDIRPKLKQQVRED